jgi:hypothetical protein
MRTYAAIEPFEVADAFFSGIGLVELAKLFEGGRFSLLNQFVTYLTHYLRRVNHPSRRNQLISAIIQKIDLEHYAQYINENIRERWEKACQPEYDSESAVALASNVTGVSQRILQMSSLAEDQSTKDSARAKLSSMYSQIDFRTWGKLLEAKKKELGPVRGILNAFRRAGGGKEQVVQLLSELDFKRLAMSYNQAPVGNVTLSEFCRTYLSTKELLPEWKVFFETVDFRLIYRGGRQGFNFVDNTIIFQVLIQVFYGDETKLTEVLESFDFEQIGSKARGRKPRSVSQLFKHLEKTNLGRERYREFVEAFGVDECKRCLQANDSYLPVILRYKCEYDDEALKRFMT